MTGITGMSLRAALAAGLFAAACAPAAAAGALAIGACGAYGQTYGFSTVAAAEKRALAQCEGKDCRIVARMHKSCAAFAVDADNPCGAHGAGQASRLGRAQNNALRQCYRDGGKDCVIRTFVCDGKG